MAKAAIYANPDFILVQACAGLRRFRTNPEKSPFLLAPNATNSEIGQAVLSALDNYKQLAEKEIGTFFDLENVERDYTNWVTNLVEKFKYKNRKALFQSMKHCTVNRENGTITFQPTRHEKLEAWSGTGIKREDFVAIQASDSLEEVGKAATTAMERCNDRPER